MKRFATWALAAALFGGGASAEDWPRWRGPRADGTWRGPKLPEKWPAEGLSPRWKQPIGGGYAGIAVAGGRCFTMDRPEKTDKARTPDGRERVVSFDVRDGRLLWEHAYPAHYGDLDYGNGPRAMPTVVGERVYTLGAVGMAACLDAKTGKPIWTRDTVKELGAVVPTWGFSGSPLLVDHLVLFHVGAQPGGSLVALDAADGTERWRSLPDPAGYGTPILIDAPSGKQVVIWTPENVHGLDPETGMRLWTIPYKVTYGVSIATPIYQQGIVFVTGYWEGSKAIQLGKSPGDAKVLWTDERNLRGLMAPPLYRDGRVYSLDKQFGLTCFELATGKKLWDDEHRMTPKGRNPQATFVWAGEGDRVLVLNSEGELILARFTPAGYEESARTKILGPTWANPAFAGDSVYARNDEEIVRVPLVSSPVAAAGAIRAAAAAVEETEQKSEPARTRIDPPKNPRVDEALVGELLEKWQQATAGWKDVRYRLEVTQFDARQPEEEVSFAELSAAAPDVLRIDWKNEEGEVTGISLWNKSDFRYFNFEQENVLTLLHVDQTAEAEKKASFADRIALAMVRFPKKVSFLFYRADAKNLRDRFRIKVAEETKEKVWLQFEAKSEVDKAGFDSFLVELDRQTGVPSRAAFLESIDRQTLFAVQKRETNLAPPLSAAVLQENLPKDFRPVGP